MSIFSRFQKKEEAVKKPAVASALDGPAVAAPAVTVPAVQTPRGTHRIAWRVLAHPRVSEKASLLGAHGQYVFVVDDRATKTDVRRAVEEAYGVRPIAVHIVRRQGKSVRYGRTTGTTKTMKKAIVTLPKGKTIQVYEGV